jgi:pimeloyl-ACP methyl ester carboxylesterase
MTNQTEKTATAVINDVRLAYEISGTEEIPLVMVHGGLLSRRNWDWVVPYLAESFRILTYDRRGYGESERPSGQGSAHRHVADLAALIEHLGLGPVWAAGQSFGGNIVVRLAAERPDLLQGITAHEPDLFSLVADDPAVAPMLEDLKTLNTAVTERITSGDHAGAAKQFVEEGLGEGLWSQLPPEFRQIVTNETPNVLEELNDPDGIVFDLESIRGFTRPALLTFGDQTAPVFPPVITRLAETMSSAEISTFTGAGHIPQVEQPKNYAETITAFVHRHTA